VRQLRIVVVGVLALLSVGCASIIHGSRQGIFINSVPSGATATVRDEYGMVVASQGTPCTLRLQRGSGFFSGATYTIAVEKPGYDPVNMMISSRLSFWYLGGNCLIGGLWGWLIVDPITGGMWKLKPSAINVTLPKQAGLPPHDRDRVTVVLREGPPAGLTPLVVPLRR